MGPEEIAVYCEKLFTALSKTTTWGREDKIHFIEVALRERMRYAAEKGYGLRDR